MLHNTLFQLNYQNDMENIPVDCVTQLCQLQLVRLCFLSVCRNGTRWQRLQYKKIQSVPELIQSHLRRDEIR